MMRMLGIFASAQLSSGSGGGFTAHAVRSAGSGNYLYQTSFGRFRAVHFDGATKLHNPALITSGDSSGLLSCSFWFKFDNFSGQVWTGDPENVYRSNVYLSSGVQNKVIAFLTDDYTSSDQFDSQGSEQDFSMSTGVWYNILMAVSTNHGAGQKIEHLYINDIDRTRVVSDVGPAFLMLFNGLSLWVGDDSYGNEIQGDMTDFWFAPGQFVDFSIEANRRKFIDADGKPVYLGADGSTPTGTAPAVFFSGDADSFATNRGTGGAFTLTGTLTNASFAPADGRDYFRVQWLRGDNNYGQQLVVDPEGNYATFESTSFNNEENTLLFNGQYADLSGDSSVEMDVTFPIVGGAWNLVMRAVHIALMPPTLAAGPVALSGDGSSAFVSEYATNRAYHSSNSGATWTIGYPASSGGEANLCWCSGALLYITTWGVGVSRSNDGGLNATLLDGSPQYPHGLGASSDGTVIAVSTNLETVSLSVDSGSNWNTILDLSGVGGVIPTVFISADGQYIVALDSQNGNVHWSDDQGDTFHEVSLSSIVPQKGCSSADAQRIVLCGNNNEHIFLSANGGVTWDQQTIEASNFATQLCCSSNGLVVYRLGVSEAGGNHQSLYKSTDGGTTWTDLTDSLPSGDDMMTRDPTSTRPACSADGNIVLLHGSKLYRSTNGGTSFTQVGDYSKVGLRVNGTDIDLSGSVSADGAFPFDIAMTGLPVYLYDDTFGDGYAGAIGPDMAWGATSSIPNDGYNAPAVHFDHATWLVNDSLTATDNGFFSAAGWFKIDTQTNSTFFAVDPENSYTTTLNYSPVAHEFGADIQDVDDSNELVVETTGNAVSDGVWHSFVISGSTNFSTGNKKGKLYIDDVDVTHLVDSSAAFTMAFNGLPVWFGNDASAEGVTGDFADIRIMPGVSLLDGDDDIPEATRRLFVDAEGKPVDPAVATAELGAPCILFSGDATSFADNQGTGGSFTLTGSLTDADSPSYTTVDVFSGDTIDPAMDALFVTAAAGYRASAVTFGGSAWLDLASFVGGDGSTVFYSFRVFCPADQGGAIAVTDPDGAGTNHVSVGNGLVTVFLSDDEGNNQVRFTGALTEDVWHDVLIAAKTDTAPQVVKLYVDDTDVTTIDYADDPAFTMAFNGLRQVIGAGGFGDGLVASLSDYMMGTSNLLTDGDVPEAVRRLFTDEDGRPVDPAVAVGELGTPLVLLEGDAAAFVENQGSAGTPVLTGSIDDATSSPSGAPLYGATPKNPAVAIAELGTPAWCNVGPAADFAANALGSAGAWTVVGEFTDDTDSEPIVIGGSGSGGDAYVAQAVHFDDTTWLSSTASLTATDSPLMSASFWVKYSSASPSSDLGTLFCFDPDNGYAPYGTLIEESIGRGELAIAAYPMVGDGDYQLDAPAGSVGADAWHNVLISVDTGHGAGAKLGQIYVDDVSVGSVTTNNGSAFDMVFDAVKFFFPTDGSPGDVETGDYADVWWGTGQYVDFSVEANRRKFIDAEGKPVDLGADGSTPTGTAPAVFFSGDASSFATNKGTGGAFTLTGSLTDASTSPSD